MLRHLVLLNSIFIVVHSFLEYSLIKMDKRLEDSNGLVNPVALLGVLVTLPSSTPGVDEWTTLSSTLNQVYSANNSAQSSISGLVIDSWNSVVNNNFQSSSATLQGVSILMDIENKFNNTVVPLANQMFYNPFDPSLIAQLNSSDIWTYDLSPLARSYETTTVFAK